jgi:hypothetical protein
MNVASSPNPHGGTEAQEREQGYQQTSDSATVAQSPVGSSVPDEHRNILENTDLGHSFSGYGEEYSPGATRAKSAEADFLDGNT